jgi:hypothetical protein
MVKLLNHILYLKKKNNQKKKDHNVLQKLHVVTNVLVLQNLVKKLKLQKLKKLLKLNNLKFN